MQKKKYVMSVYQALSPLLVALKFTSEAANC